MNGSDYQTISNTELKKLLQLITPASEEYRELSHEHWASLAKPLGSLGLLEQSVENICALTESEEPDISKRCVLVFCSDNGVVAQDVTQSDSSVTGIVARNLAAGRTSVCRMAEVANCTVIPVDMGIKDFAPEKDVLDRRIWNGTADISLGQAMTRQQCELAILAGAELVRQMQDDGFRLIATGEMGIGNTTTSSAVASCLLDKDVTEMTGRGAGLSDAGLQRKIMAIVRALVINNPDPKDPIDVLSKVGGFDICGMCGAFLGGAAYKVPVIVDGFISAVAALCARRLCKNAGKALLASHVSAEPAGMTVLNELGLRPIITGDMRLGEGTGAVALIPLLDMACAVYSEGYTFSEGGIEPYVPQN